MELMSELSKLRLQIFQTQIGDFNENFTANLISAQSLIRKCENLIRVSINETTTSEGFKSISEESLLRILNHPHLNIS